MKLINMTRVELLSYIIQQLPDVDIYEDNIYCVICSKEKGMPIVCGLCQKKLEEEN